MKRLLYILTLSLALAVGTVSVTMVASPRIEQVSSDEASVQGGKGTIAMIAGDSDWSAHQERACQCWHQSYYRCPQGILHR